MKNTFTLGLRTVAFVAMVHAIGGIGLGVWLAEHIPVRRRRRVALALMALGVTLHVPMRREVMRGRHVGPTAENVPAPAPAPVATRTTERPPGGAGDGEGDAV